MPQYDSVSRKLHQPEERHKVAEIDRPPTPCSKLFWGAADYNHEWRSTLSTIGISSVRRKPRHYGFALDTHKAIAHLPLPGSPTL